MTRMFSGDMEDRKFRFLGDTEIKNFWGVMRDRNLFWEVLEIEIFWGGVREIFAVDFTNEAHFDPSQTFEERVLREESTRYKSENLQRMPDMKEVKMHVAVSIS